MKSTDELVLVDRYLEDLDGNRYCLPRKFETRPMEFFRDY